MSSSLGSRLVRAASPWGLALVLWGCLDAREVKDDAAEPCAACHGDPTRDGDALIKAAPPSNVDGESAPSALGVGAHQVHLRPDGRAAPVPCAACHIVPAETFAPGHVDTALPAEITFGEEARRGDRAPRYDAQTGTCADVYCHGAAEPAWLEPRTPAEACGTCHALPPPAPHPSSEDCADCHGNVVGPDGDFVAPELHINGEVDVGELPCNGCHGAGEEGGPPPDTEGGTLVSDRGVGAHATHLVASATHGPVDCAECHVVPEAVGDQGHIDEAAPADVTFGSLARLDSSAPTYDAEALTCAGSYCHGDATPHWTTPRTSDDACGTCHGVPPAAPHPQNETCGACHGAVIDLEGNFTAPERHVDGVLDLELGCGSCHGSSELGGPPPDTLGNTSVTARGVGAHAAHLGASYSHAPLACAECHVVPASVDEPGHIDAEAPADVTFGALARLDSSAPVYDAEALTCAGSYCHGAATPEWTAPRSSDDACGSCHGVPPAAPHPQSATCGACHGAVIDAAGEFVAPERHVDGVLDLELGCSSCHGTGALGGPPPDTLGNTSVTARGVGAHAAHLQASYSHAPVACTECHVVPALVDDAGHIDEAAPADVVFGALAQLDASTPAYDPTALTCAGSYCHGGATPEWTAPRSSDDACGTCHGVPPAAPHPQNALCGQCHGAVMAVDGSFVAPERHVDGVLDLGPLPCSACHGTGPLGAPPPDVAGSSDPTEPGVGAHVRHLTATATHGAIGCDECHVVPASYDAPGHRDDPPAELVFGTIATTDGATPVYSASAHTCAGSYCHGAATPSWVAPLPDAAVCGSCHALPPPAPHPPVSDCSRCHGAVIGAGRAFVAPELHVNGIVEVELSCNSCHGTGASGAPPPDLTGDLLASAPGVGAHVVHLAGGTFRPVPCAECHVVPADVDASGHVDDWGSAEVVMSGVAATEGASPTFDPSTLTCGNTWCHGPRGARASSPVWTTQPNLTCARCHDFPPPAPHPALFDCSTCHSTVDSDFNIVLPDQHVNGVIDF